MRAGQWVVAGMLAVLVCATGAGGWMVYEQDSQIRELEASMAAVSVAREDAEQANATLRADTEAAITTLLDVLEVKQGVDDPYVSKRLDDIEQRLGAGSSISLPGEESLPAVEGRLDDLAVTLNAVCTSLQLNGYALACQ